MVSTFFQLPQSKNTGSADTIACGPRRTPGVGAGSIATPATPSPRFSKCWTHTPPAEWPIRIGSSGHSPMMRLIMIEDLGDAEAGELLVRLRAQLFGRAVVIRPVGRDDGEALRLVPRLDRVPAARVQPGAVDEQDGVGHAREASHVRVERTRRRRGTQRLRRERVYTSEAPSAGEPLRSKGS